MLRKSTGAVGLSRVLPSFLFFLKQELKEVTAAVALWAASRHLTDVLWNMLNGSNQEKSKNVCS